MLLKISLYPALHEKVRSANLPRLGYLRKAGSMGSVQLILVVNPSICCFCFLKEMGGLESNEDIL